jgi:hypothetical protein
VAELLCEIFVIAMFSWKKNPKEQQSVGINAKQNSLDNMDFSDLLKDPVDSFGTEDGGDDMDPDLLVCLVSPLVAVGVSTTYLQVFIAKQISFGIIEAAARTQFIFSTPQV